MLNNHVTFIVVILGVTTSLGDARNSFIFIGPNEFRPGRDYIIHGRLLDTPKSEVLVKAYIQKSGVTAPLTQSQVPIRDQRDVQIDLKIPMNIDKMSGTWKVHVEGSGGDTFSKSQTIKFQDKVTSLYIQTDKSIYKPGQTVNFRVFGVTPDLRVVFDKLHVELHDPRGNKINQWSVSGAELTSAGGVYVQHQVMSESPELGQWKLKAKLLSYMNEFEEKTFKVDEYVLPKFEASLDLPPFGRLKDTVFTGNVKASYTFGKSVKGIVDLRIKPKNERFQFRNGQRTSISKTIEMKFPIEGKASFTVPTSRLEEIEKFLDRASLVFEVNVTEDLTKYKQSDSKELTFYRQSTKVEFPSSLPKTFKPGMTYDAVVKISQQDGSPPDTISDKLKVTVTETRETRLGEQDPFPMSRSFESPGFGRRFRHNIPISWFPPFTQLVDKTLPKTYHVVPTDGVVEVPITVGNDVTKIRVKASYDSVSATTTFKKRHSPSDNYMQLRLKTLSPQAGKPVVFEVKTTEPVDEIAYQVFARGVLVASGTLSIHSRRQDWTFPTNAYMAPKARIVASYVRSDGEVVADALTININGAFDNKVSIAFNSSDAQPADKIRLDVTADVGSRVNILGVDKSVLLLGTGNDVDTSQVMDDLNGYSLKGVNNNNRPFCDWFCWRWPMPSGGNDVKDVFDEAGVVVLTDARVYEHRERKHGWVMSARHPMRSFVGSTGGVGFARRVMPRMEGAFLSNKAPRPAMLDAGIAMAKEMQVTEADLVPPKDVAPIQRTRKLFPETWLWRTETITSSGTAHIEETVPDTITSWMATAFAVHPETGLGITDNAAQLTVSMPFFATVNLPYSVIRGEKVILQANIHNYSPESLFVYVTLDKSDDFENIIISGSTQSTTSMEQKRTLTVGSNSVSAVYFPIIPRTIGKIDISVKAQSNIMADAVVKKLLVEAEGSPREYNIPFVAELKESGSLTKVVNVEYPLRTVSGSEKVRATVIGDLMGPSINGLDKLLKMPTGCGEQNMLKFAPNIFVTKYLEATNSLDTAVITKSREFMEAGLQRELTYRHSDGSFSAFGSRDDSGSTWLTAFVVKSFVQAMPYVFVDDAVVNKAIDWLVKQQNTDGTFNEPGRVIHKAMQGGSASGKISLTAYVLITLLEARTVEGVAGRIVSAQKEAQGYLETNLLTLTDVYDLAIVAYALQLANSPKATAAWDALNAKAKVEAGTRYWQRETKDTSNVKPYERRNGVAVDIELTSYALLLLANKGDRVNGVQVLKWITEQRNPEGGFSSTQDTVLALQGLAEMAAVIYTDQYDLTVDIVGTGFTDTLTINSLNARVLQSRDLPADVGAVTMTVRGTGLALVQIEVSYNIDDDAQKKSFQLDVTLPRETLNDFDVMACARWLDAGSSSMAVMEIGSPSGFVHDLVSVMSEPAHKRADLDLNKLVLYFDEIGAQNTCTTVTLHRIGLVAGAQPVPIRIYDYYEPTKQVTEFYVPVALRNSEVCDVCGAECDVCQKQ